MATTKAVTPVRERDNEHENAWDLRFVSLEYSTGGGELHGDEASKTSAVQDGPGAAASEPMPSGGRRRVRWPCLYFPSMERLAAALVKHGFVPPEGEKYVKYQCSRLRLHRSSEMKKAGKKIGLSVVFLLGDHKTQPGARERAKYKLKLPIWIPEEEPVDFVEHVEGVEDEHRQLGTFNDAFGAAMETDVVKIMYQADADEEIVARAWWSDKTFSEAFEQQGQQGSSWREYEPLSAVPEEAKTPPPPAAKATAPPVVTEARPDHPSAGHPASSASDATGGIQASVPLQDLHARTPAAASAAGGSRLGGDNDAAHGDKTEVPAKSRAAAEPRAQEEATAVPEGTLVVAKDLGSSAGSDKDSDAPGVEESGPNMSKQAVGTMSEQAMGTMSEQAMGTEPEASTPNGQEDAAFFSSPAAENQAGSPTNGTLAAPATSELEISLAGLVEAPASSHSDPPLPLRDAGANGSAPNVEMASKPAPTAAAAVEAQAVTSPSVERETALLLSPRAETAKNDESLSPSLSTDDGDLMAAGDLALEENITNDPALKASSGSSTVVTVDGAPSPMSPPLAATGSASKPVGKKGAKSVDSSKRRKNSAHKAPKSSPKPSKTTENSKSKLPLRQLKPVPTFEQVKPALEKAGFRFHENRYERPSGSGSTEAFGSQRELRVDLCAYGLNDYDGWTDQERALVKEWVQYTHANVDSGRSYLAISDSQFKSYHERLGIAKDHDLYTFPDGSPPQTLFTPKDLRQYLSRFGLPPGCDLEALDPVERVSFDVYVSHSSKPFERIERGDMSFSGRKRRPTSYRESLGSVSEGRQVAEPVALFAAKEPSKRKRDSVSTETATEKRRLVEHMTPKSSPTNEATETSASALPVASASDIVTPPLRRREVEPRTYKEMLTACQDLMTKPHTLIYPPNSDFDQNTKKIEGFLKALIESEGSHGLAEGTPASLYVCGAPGLGKTAAVRSCCEKLKSEFSRDDGTNLRKPLVCYINANNMQSSLDPELLVLERMADTLEMQNFRSPHITAIKGTMTRKKSQILIVIDELDMLLSEQEDAYSDAILKHEEALQTVAGWASDPDVPVGFVGIANRKGNAKFERLKQLGGFQEVIDFKAYSKDDISHIVGELIGRSTFDKGALEFLAVKTSQIRGGDLRFALESVSDAASICLKTMSDSELSAVANPDKPPIKLQIFNQVFRKESNLVKDTVNGLPSVGKGMLIVLSTLSQEKVYSTTIRELKKFAEMVAGNNDPTGTENFILILSTICDKGLIEIVGGGELDLASKSHAELTERSVKLGLSLEEVNAVVNDDLCKNHQPYAALRDNVKKKIGFFKPQAEGNEKSRRKK